jgi:glycosyltransferase involved in cell wall biosynthesis
MHQSRPAQAGKTVLAGRVVYSGIVDHIFADWRDRPVRLLELDAPDGATLAAWAAYFSQAQLALGCSAQGGNGAADSVKALRRITGDTGDSEVRAEIMQFAAHFDIVIYAGADFGARGINRFAQYFELLAEGGVFVLEHRSLDADARAKLVDELGEYYASGVNAALLSQVQSIEFFGTLIVVRKKSMLSQTSAHAVQLDAAKVLEKQLHQHVAELAQRDALIAALRASSSWRLMAPLRLVATQVYRTRRAVSLIGPALRVGGGASNTARRALRLYRNEGWAGIKRGLRIAASAGQVVPSQGSGDFHRNDYTEWVRRYDCLDAQGRQRISQRIEGFVRRPLISILMPVYNAPPKYLQLAIESVRAQLYGNWELCIADDASTEPAVRQILREAELSDARIKVIYREKNGHISASSNSALQLAMGQFVALLDHDDLLAETALFRVAEAIDAHPDAILIYSDEDKIDAANRRYEPYFKSELNYELLLAQNMISHLGVYRTETLRELGGFRVGYEGAQDYDLALRVVERAMADQIIHVPYVLYHWRAIAGSTALDEGEKDYAAEAGRKAVAEHLARRGVAAEVLPAPEGPSLNRVRFACPSPQPMVSIIIPTRDRAELLGMCLDSLIERSTYANYEVIIVDNGSTEKATEELFARLPKDRFRVVRDESPFNFSALNNGAARVARGELLCLMNNDIEIITPEWLEEMVAFATQSEIGCVGARLWYPDGRLQHGGVIIGLGGVAGHAHKYFPKGDPGYFRRAVLHQSLSAVTAACLLLRREIFEEVGGLDEQLAVAFNDIDFCLRVRQAGYRNVWTPYAEMVHHESASRGHEDTAAKQARFAAEIEFVQARWGRALKEDPAYSPNLTLDSEDYAYAWPPRSNWQ